MNVTESSREYGARSKKNEQETSHKIAAKISYVYYKW